MYLREHFALRETAIYCYYRPLGTIRRLDREILLRQIIRFAGRLEPTFAVCSVTGRSVHEALEQNHGTGVREPICGRCTVSCETFV